jgi:hypothetical protein
VNLVRHEPPSFEEIDMPPRPKMPPAYRQALEDFAAACRDAHTLADLLEYIAGLLRGRPAEGEMPARDLAERTREVRRLLERVARARESVRAAWADLSPAEREGAPTPEELLEVET